MLILEKIQLTSAARRSFKTVGVVALLFALLLVAANARAAAYYSGKTPIDAELSNSNDPTGKIQLSITAPTVGANITATVTLPKAGTARLRYQLNGTAPAGYRAGVLVSALSTVFGINALSSITLRTYLSTGPTTAKMQEQVLIQGSVAQAQLLAGRGDPAQLEFTSTADFDQVEIEFGSVVSLNPLLNPNPSVNLSVYYAYGIGPNQAAQVLGFTSNFPAGAAGPYSATGCTGKIANAGNAVDSDLTNYATFGSLLSVGCNPQLQVGLTGTAPGSYRAGFVIGQGNTLLDASVLGGLTLRTYKDGVLQETAAGAALLGLSVLPDGKSLVSFPASKPFDAVSIERTDAVAALDNLRLYYGVGVAAATPPPVISAGFTDGNAHYTTQANGLACVACGVSSPANGAGDPNAAATISTGLGVANWKSLTLDLNGTGRAGNRAGMVIGNSSLLDANALSRTTLVTYDDQGNVLETATGTELLQLNVLPNGRRVISFNTTHDFAKVGIRIGGLATVVSNTDVYYAFSDASNGELSIITPTGPLPVVLTSFGVRRLPGAAGAEISWTTATELNSSSFTVERSAQPGEGFVAIGRVAAAGTSTSQHRYTLRDADATGQLYYRLRQLDADGRATLSPVAVLAAGPAEAAFTLYPNPAPATAQQVTLGTSGASVAGYSVCLYSGLGQLLSRKVLSAADAAAPTIRIAGLETGLYHVVLRNAAGQAVSAQRLVIQ